MARFFATTSRGLVDALLQELEEIGLKVVKKSTGGVFFEGSWEACYRANLYSRTATRILKPLLEFPAYQPEELYDNIKKHDFTKYIKPEQSIKIEASISDSKMRDQRLIAMKVKDAIVDQFRDVYGTRPDVEKDNPDLKIFIRGRRNNFDVALDTSGDSLFMRGYRRDSGLAPIKEHLAAGLLILSGWDRKSPLIDPMCGSGTFLTEAALMAMDVAPGTLRTEFGFQKLQNYNEELWTNLVDEALTNEKEDLDFKIYGFDVNGKILSGARHNAKRAGVESVIQFVKRPISLLEPPEGIESGTIIVNPPYAARLGDVDELKDVYRDFSFALKQKFKGWDVWVLAGNKDLMSEFNMKTSRKIFAYNGPIECRFLKYSIF